MFYKIPKKVEITQKSRKQLKQFTQYFNIICLFKCNAVRNLISLKLYLKLLSIKIQHKFQ